jgi:hypothetical protein
MRTNTRLPSCEREQKNKFDRLLKQSFRRALLSGPLDATFIVYGDFDNYVTGTVYQHKSGGFEGLHSVKIVGYGVQDNVPYWTVQNSWVQKKR